MQKSLIDLYNWIFVELLFSCVGTSRTLFFFVLLGEFATLLTLIYDPLNIQQIYMSKPYANAPKHISKCMLLDTYFTVYYSHSIKADPKHT